MEVAGSSTESSPLLTQGDGRKKHSNIFQNITIEPVVLLHSFGWSLSEVMLTDQIVYQSCVVTLGSKEGVCSQLGNDDNTTATVYLEELVQPYAAAVSMAIVLLTSVVPAIAALFFGPWSDKFGRKPIIAVASIGYLLTDLLVILISFLSSYYALTPWLYVVAHIPVSVLGGYSVFNAGIYSFMNDITTDSNRTIRMGVLQGFTMLGVLSGLLASSYLCDFTSITVMFSISATVTLVSVIYLMLATTESIVFEGSFSKTEQLNAIFNINLVQDMINTFSQVRPNYERAITWLLIAVGGMVEFAIAGRVLFFLYTRREFGWNIESYSLWLSAELGVIMLGNLFGIALLKKLFKVTDLGLLAISTVNHLGDYLIKGFARQGWQLYLTTFTTPFKGIDSAAVRSILSTILPNDDIGKIYAMDLSIKAITPLVSVFLFTYLYNSTINSAPSTYLFVMGAIFGFNLLFIGAAYNLLKWRSDRSGQGNSMDKYND